MSENTSPKASETPRLPMRLSHHVERLLAEGGGAFAAAMSDGLQTLGSSLKDGTSASLQAEQGWIVMRGGWHLYRGESGEGFFAAIYRATTAIDVGYVWVDEAVLEAEAPKIVDGGDPVVDASGWIVWESYSCSSSRGGPKPSPIRS